MKTVPNNINEGACVKTEWTPGICFLDCLVHKIRSKTSLSFTCRLRRPGGNEQHCHLLHCALLHAGPLPSDRCWTRSIQPLEREPTQTLVLSPQQGQTATRTFGLGLRGSLAPKRPRCQCWPSDRLWFMHGIEGLKNPTVRTTELLTRRAQRHGKRKWTPNQQGLIHLKAFMINAFKVTEQIEKRQYL